VLYMCIIENVELCVAPEMITGLYIIYMCVGCDVVS